MTRQFVLPVSLMAVLVLFALAVLLAPWLAGHAGGNAWVRMLDFALLYLMLALGLNIVVADNVQKVPISRNATVEDWEAVMKDAVEQRFGRYNGTKLYNIGISVDGYALAPPGIPVVAAPKSVLVITANIWDDAAQLKLNPEGERFTVFESLSGETVIGTGITRTKQQQMDAQHGL